MELFKINKIEKLENDIRHLFQVEDLIFGELSFGGTIPIVFVRLSNNEILAKTWKDFNGFLAAEYMTLITDEYSKWNFYIFYFSGETVDKPLKYEIENNKFSSRKIVVENCETINETEINNVISEHITNDNIKIDVGDKQISTFKKDTSLEKILNKLNLTKKNDEELQKTLDLIEKTYSDEV